MFPVSSRTVNARMASERFCIANIVNNYLFAGHTTAFSVTFYAFCNQKALVAVPFFVFASVFSGAIYLCLRMYA